MKGTRAIVRGAVGMLFSLSAAAQGPSAPDQATFGPYMEPTMIRVVPNPDETYGLPGAAPAVTYSCYRIGRCSAYDLYRFRDRPNRLTRLAPESPAETDDLRPSIRYVWSFVPITPEENILPEYRTASQVRDEYRGAGMPFDSGN